MQGAGKPASLQTGRVDRRADGSPTQFRQYRAGRAIQAEETKMPQKPKTVLDMKHGVELTEETGREIFADTINALKKCNEKDAAAAFEAACLTIKNLKHFEAFMISRRLRQEIEEWLEKMPAAFRESYRTRADKAKADLRAERFDQFEAERRAEAESSAKFFIPSVS